MIVNANSVVQHVSEIKNRIIQHVNMNVKIIVSAKKIISWNPSTCICKNDNYLESTANTSLIECDEIISVVDIVSTKITNTIATNVSIHSDSKKVRYEIDCYVLRTLFITILYSYLIITIILLLIITIVCYHYAKHRSKTKSIDALAI